jgi:hypothetical protein
VVPSDCELMCQRGGDQARDGPTHMRRGDLKALSLSLTLSLGEREEIS